MVLDYYYINTQKGGSIAADVHDNMAIQAFFKENVEHVEGCFLT